jgi:hypothetical protein
MPVHRNTARLNHFFRVPARRNPSVRKNFLEPLLHNLL